MIDTLVFDFGGVILSDDDKGIIVDNEKTKQLLMAKQEQLQKGWDKAWPLAKVGKINENVFFKIFLEEAIGLSGEKNVSELKKIYRSKVKTLPAFQLLAGLKIKYRLIALTNIAKNWLDFKKKKYCLDKYFELIISSCNEGTAKPNREIYKKLILKSKIDPSKSLFIDDMKRNIDAAKEIGLKTYLFDNKKGLEGKFRELGIIYD